MKSFMLYEREIPTTEYNLQWVCPHCNSKQIVYYFQNWKYKSRFWCGMCKKVVYRNIKND